MDWIFYTEIAYNYYYYKHIQVTFIIRRYRTLTHHVHIQVIFSIYRRFTGSCVHKKFCYTNYEQL